MYISYSHFAAYNLFCILQTPAIHLCIQPIILFLLSTLCAYLALDPIYLLSFFCSAVVLFSHCWSLLFKNIYTFTQNTTTTLVSVPFTGYYLQCIIMNHPISIPAPPFYLVFRLCSPNSPFIYSFYTYIHDSCFLACIDILCALFVYFLPE